MVNVMGVYCRTIEDPSEMGLALNQALKSGKPAVLNGPVYPGALCLVVIFVDTKERPAGTLAGHVAFVEHEAGAFRSVQCPADGP